ncbi:MAG: transporter substrate-binding domain-containing protein [Clostridia bacterium]|nr:transporter substrate-binding domain-containing protein [Clostridia bacterium]
MKKITKIIVAILTLAVMVGCVSVFAACKKEEASITDATPEGIKKYGSLVVATNAYFPPFEYKDEETGKITGWDMDIAQKLADKLGVKLVIADMEFDSVLLAPGANKAHISMAGISYSEKRDQTLDFSVGVFDSSQVIIVKNDSDIAGPFDLGGKTVGVQSGTVGQLLAQMDPDWAGEGEDACLAAPGNVSKYTTGAEAVLALTQGKVDAVIIDKFPAQKFVENYQGVKICEETVFDDEYAFAVKEGNKELQQWLNEAIAEMKADGTMAAINAKYFG